MVKSVFLFLFLVTQLVVTQLLFPHDIVIELVHGTWAKKSDWHKPGSDFCSTLCHGAEKTYGIFNDSALDRFIWSGKLTHEARLKAGEQLAQKLKQYNNGTRIHIFAHSHGANVVFIASRILQQQKSLCRIETCSVFGAPINIERYAPDMAVIKYLYNFFSLKDVVQPVFGLYKRVFPKHSRIANITLKIDGKEPGHGDFLCTTVARWLPSVHALCLEKTESFALFSYQRPGAIDFFQHKKPTYALDPKRQFLLEEDELLQKRLMLSYCKRNSLFYFPQNRHGLSLDTDLFESLLENDDEVLDNPDFLLH